MRVHQTPQQRLAAARKRQRKILARIEVLALESKAAAIVKIAGSKEAI
jgi:hypothetical protein